jgi:hypothetical protein
MQFGKIKKLNPRDIWHKEAKDFTPWLADNIGALGEALGMELKVGVASSFLVFFSAVSGEGAGL